MKFFILIFVFLFLEGRQASAVELKYTCNSPFWNAPAETKNGMFSGDLSLNCFIEDGSESDFNLMNLRRKIIDKLKSESFVNQGPESGLLISTSPLTWDVSHRFEEDGNLIQIREWVTISLEDKLKSSPPKSEGFLASQLTYETHSKEISASGMASYLRYVEFKMIVSKNKNNLAVNFRNKVHVKRPWYAPDLIFAPIARKICFKKLAQVKEKFMPWISLAIDPVRDYQKE